MFFKTTIPISFIGQCIMYVRASPLHVTNLWTLCSCRIWSIRRQLNADRFCLWQVRFVKQFVL